MASVIVLADAVSASSSYTSDAQWVEAGLPITIQYTITGSGEYPNVSLQGSLDGTIWSAIPTGITGTNESEVIGLGFSSFSGPLVNYIRVHSDGSGGGGRAITLKAIQPNNVQVDVDNFPA